MDQLTLLSFMGLDITGLSGQLEAGLKVAVDASIETLYPEEIWMLTIPLTIAMVVSVISSLYLAIGYFPNVTSTAMQLRTGMIPTLGSDRLDSYRVAADTVTLLCGALFWGCLFAGILVGSLIGLAVFFFLWQGSVFFAQKFIAVFVGVFVIGCIRFLVMFAGRMKFFRAFYRSRPAAANIYFLAMDWANFGLAAGFVFVRMMKLMVVSAFSIGRIDRDFLAKDVGKVAGYDFDAFPTIHTRELMSHDAHRHPFLESLGTIYLMKLRHGMEFGNSAGSCFRLIFVYALMPW